VRLTDKLGQEYTQNFNVVMTKDSSGVHVDTQLAGPPVKGGWTKPQNGSGQ
jgi:hypothetical protein